MKYSLLYIAFIILCSRAMAQNYAQQNVTDSLLTMLKVAKNDTVKANALAELTASLPEGEWVPYNDQLNTLVEANLKNCKSTILCNFYKEKQACVLENYGYQYMNSGDVSKSIYYYLKGLKIHESLNCFAEVAATYGNIGFVYQQQSNFQKALEYYTKSLELSKKINFQEGIATGYNNLGSICKNFNKNEDAILNYKKALAAYAVIDDVDGLATSSNNIGIIYRRKNDNNAALNWFKKALIEFKKTKDTEGFLFCLNNIGNVYADLKQYDLALKYSDSSYAYASKVNTIDGMKISAKSKYKIYKATKQYDKALEMYEKYVSLKDSIKNEKNHIAILEQQYQYNEEKQVLKHEKQLAIEKAEQQKTKIISYTIILILVIVLVFSVWLYKKFKETSKQKSIIEIQKLEVEEQKKLVDEHQKEIQDSINYAKRIQTSFLASKSEFESFTKNYFVLFKPKDVVSGDFYWANSINDDFYVCAADSTGHGIPGAFMSLLNISLLNEAVLSKNLTSTAEILNFARKILILGLKPDESGQGGNDGMDCVMVKINKTSLMLEYSGANNPLWIIRNDALIELKADKMSVGRSLSEHHSFTKQEFQLHKNDMLYLFTDGYADQFGGPKGKKYKYKPLNELLISMNQLPLNQQLSILESTFQNWKGSLEQVDDVCVIGIKI